MWFLNLNKHTFGTEYNPFVNHNGARYFSLHAGFLLHAELCLSIPYKWIYWRVEYLAICLKNSVGVILIWRNGR